jgi:hypothetical protein
MHCRSDTRGLSDEKFEPGFESKGLCTGPQRPVLPRIGVKRLASIILAGSKWSKLVADQLAAAMRLVKTGGRLIKHARYYWLLLAESHLTRRLFGRERLGRPLPARLPAPR